MSLCRTHILAMFMVFLWLPLSYPAAAQDKTAQIKAVFLFKFADYVTWPRDIPLRAGGVFSLCVWGGHPFGNTLDVIAAKQRKYKYKIKYYSAAQNPKNCHLVFTEMSASHALKLKGPFLVGDSSNFAHRGGMVEMSESRGKIKLIGNLRAAEKTGYKISSRLLDIMDVIR